MAEFTVMAGLSSDHLWNAYKETDEFKNALKWALATHYDDRRPISDFAREQHVIGSLRMAFTKGIEANG